MRRRSRFCRIGLAAALLVPTLAGQARAGDGALFSPEPDPVTTTCGGRCLPEAHAAPRLDSPMTAASADSFPLEQEPPPGLELRLHPRSRSFDAVEGTELDPLSNKTFDLNFPKTVPPLR